MSPKSTREYIQAIQLRYRKAPRSQKGQLLDEACRVTGYHRKAVLRILHRASTPHHTPRRGRPRHYGPPIHHVLERLWEASGRLGAKRLGPSLPELIAALERHGELTLPPATRAALFMISHATIDRILCPVRRRLGRQPYTSGRALTAIQQQVPGGSSGSAGYRWLPRRGGGEVEAPHRLDDLGDLVPAGVLVGRPVAPGISDPRNPQAPQPVMWLGDDGRACADELRKEAIGVIVPEHELGCVPAEVDREPMNSSVHRRLAFISIQASDPADIPLRCATGCNGTDPRPL